METNASGVLQVNEKGFGFLRQADKDFRPGPNDVFVPRNLIQRYSLREGVQVEGDAGPAQDGRG
ncbi:MAG TPA: transcription termination factor Rho, partial [Blastocatellia bacterium]|nr:transcription termination factor Rho [Blastocatellia bacterium]